MAQLSYSAITSLDGYVVDAAGSFDWAAPDEQVHAFVNDLVRPIGTHLFGRRMYEVMRYWEHAADETNQGDTGQSPVILDFAQIWRGADKIVYSSTLDGVTTARTRLERAFDPDAVRQLKSAAVRDLGIGGPTLAGAAIRAGLVDELVQFVNPVVVGGGTGWLPGDVRLDLDLVDTRRFDSGVVFLRYRVLTPAAR
ncbi:dihydrofolate reductase family protein [Nakamurella lactea]|uniref:dihydrofolate reductase family protein n=1 Tax=Nakamurella lactea TaxID=459515 RepID=UPI0003F63DE9|nr:dihydrofolate reductase family protein [Nakamurella lactea]